jgi:hypothetical protein
MPAALIFQNTGPPSLSAASVAWAAVGAKVSRGTPSLTLLI